MVEGQGGEREGCIVVLGATGGIGSALARRLAAKGNQLLLAGRDPAKLGALAAELGAASLVLDARRAAKASVGMHALGRIGSPADVASAIEWFLSPEQSWVTGQVLGVDGGLGSVRARPGG